MRSLILVVALVALFPVTAASQSLVGVWERVDVKFENGSDSRTLTGHGLAIFTEDHFSAMEDDAPESRPLWDDSTTDAERLANFQFFTAGAGTYELRDGVLTLRSAIAGVPNMVTSPVVFKISIEGNSMTSVFTNANGSTQTRRYIRVE